MDSFVGKLQTIQFVVGASSTVVIDQNLMPDWWLRASSDTGKTISQLFSQNPGVRAWTPFYTDFSYVKNKSVLTPELAAHETIHKFGLTDPDIQRALGLLESDVTSNISEEFKKDSLKGK